MQRRQAAGESQPESAATTASPEGEELLRRRRQRRFSPSGRPRPWSALIVALRSIVQAARTVRNTARCASKPVTNKGAASAPPVSAVNEKKMYIRRASVGQPSRSMMSRSTYRMIYTPIGLTSTAAKHLSLMQPSLFRLRTSLVHAATRMMTI